MDVGQIISRTGRGLIDIIMPPACLRCAVPVQAAGELCSQCWSKINFLAPPWCHRCGLPFAYDEGPEAECGACMAEPPSYDQARAVFAYNEDSRDLILKFKHADRTELTPALGKWMARAGAEVLVEADVIAPVPLHRWRLLRRRYNQAALLATALSAETKSPNLQDLLRRTKHTPSQGGLNRQERRKNVSGVFRVRERYKSSLSGKRVLLVDDVMTTGATANACAKALRSAGAKAVDILILARIVRDEN